MLVILGLCACAALVIYGLGALFVRWSDLSWHQGTGLRCREVFYYREVTGRNYYIDLDGLSPADALQMRIRRDAPRFAQALPTADHWA